MILAFSQLVILLVDLALWDHHNRKISLSLISYTYTYTLHSHRFLYKKSSQLFPQITMDYFFGFDRGAPPPGARFDPYGPPGVPGFEPGRFTR